MNTMQANWNTSEERLNGTLHKIEAANAQKDASNANLKVWIVTMTLGTALGVVGAIISVMRLLPPAG